MPSRLTLALAIVFLLARQGSTSAQPAGGAQPRAQPAPEAPSPAPGPLLIDGGLVVAKPAALPTGLSSGVGAGVTLGRTLAVGARIAWSTATEFTSSWIVRQSDLKLRAVAALQRAAGRGTFSLRLAAGGTLVHETRTRDQGERAGLTGDELRTTAWEMLPGADLELAVALRVVGPWVAILSGGPSVHLQRGDARSGWLASLGVAWQR